MKRFFGFKKISRVLRKVFSALTYKRSEKKRKNQVAENKGVASFRTGAETSALLGSATMRNAEQREEALSATSCENLSCAVWVEGAEERAATPKELSTAEIEAAVKAEVAAENGLAETEREKTNAEETQRVENKENNEEATTSENLAAGNDVLPIDDATPCATENPLLKGDTQVEEQQCFRAWINSEGKILLEAALEFELSARSTEFVFLRSAQGTLYRYPLRRLSIEDRVWLSERLRESLANEPFELNEAGDATLRKSGATIASVVLDEGTGANVEFNTETVAGEELNAEIVADVEVAAETAVGVEFESEPVAGVDAGDESVANIGGTGEALSLDGTIVCVDGLGAANGGVDEALSLDDAVVCVDGLGAANGGVDEALSLDDAVVCDDELNDGVDTTSFDRDDEDLRLDLWEDDAASNLGKTSDDDEDLRLSFGDEPNEPNDVSDESAQVANLNGLRGKRSGNGQWEEGTEGTRRSVGATSSNDKLKRREDKGNDAKRKKEKRKENDVKHCSAAYYEPFLGLGPEALDGLLYDYFDDFDDVKAEIEAERIVDYYDFTYGDARFRDDEWE